jgi:hypothetical protein
MKITGDFTTIHRDRVLCPDDGVHIKTKDGYLSCTHAVMCNGKLIPKGSTAFYYRNKGKGFKIFYGLDTGKRTGINRIREIANAMECAGRKFCPRVHGIVGADLDISYRGKFVKIKVPALCVEHVHWPKAFEDYIYGKPYVFDDCPNHGPDGFNRFIKKAKDVLGEQEYKLGNVLYNMRLMRWMLVDVSI